MYLHLLEKLIAKSHAMKKIPFSILALFLIFTSCEELPEESVQTIKGFYDYMHFERAGGGQIDFDLYATDNSNKLKAVVSKYNFRDTTIQIILDKSSDNTASFSDFNKALNNQVQLDGDFTQSSLNTGTWAYINFITNNEQTEVTNTDLRNSLLKIEQLVKSKIK